MEIQKTNDAALSPSERGISGVVTSTIIWEWYYQV